MNVSPSDVALLMVTHSSLGEFLGKHASPTIFHKIRKDSSIIRLGRTVLNSLKSTLEAPL